MNPAAACEESVIIQNGSKSMESWLNIGPRGGSHQNPLKPIRTTTKENENDEGRRPKSSKKRKTNDLNASLEERDGGVTQKQARKSRRIQNHKDETTTLIPPGGKTADDGPVGEADRSVANGATKKRRKSKREHGEKESERKGGAKRSSQRVTKQTKKSDRNPADAARSLDARKSHKHRSKSSSTNSDKTGTKRARKSSKRPPHDPAETVPSEKKGKSADKRNEVLTSDDSIVLVVSYEEFLNDEQSRLLQGDATKDNEKGGRRSSDSHHKEQGNESQTQPNKPEPSKSANEGKKLAQIFLNCGSKSVTPAPKSPRKSSSSSPHKKPRSPRKRTGPVPTPPSIFDRNADVIDESALRAKHRFLTRGLPDSVKKSIAAGNSGSSDGGVCSCELLPTAHVQQTTILDQSSDSTPRTIAISATNEDRVPPNLTADGPRTAEISTLVNCPRVPTELPPAGPSEGRPAEPEELTYPVRKHLLDLISSYGSGLHVKRLFKRYLSRRPDSGTSTSTSTGVDPPPQQWTDRYRPQSRDEIVGNQVNVDQLHVWLNQWKTRADRATEAEMKEVAALSSSGGKGVDVDFDIEEEYSTQSLFDDENGLCNTLLLTGLSGVGKTAAVYACAQDLGFEVLEVNASSARTSKLILSQFLEATQSHKVNNLNESTLNNSHTELPVSADQGTGTSQTRASLILFKDMDIVFEEDRGFIAAVNTIMSTAKRPIILTSTDLRIVDRLEQRFEQLCFTRPSLVEAATFLQLICLAEDILVPFSELEALLVLQNHDVRQSLLALQFYTGRGGKTPWDADLFSSRRETPGENESRPELDLPPMSADLTRVRFDSGVRFEAAATDDERGHGAKLHPGGDALHFSILRAGVDAALSGDDELAVSLRTLALFSDSLSLADSLSGAAATTPANRGRACERADFKLRRIDGRATWTVSRDVRDTITTISYSHWLDEITGSKMSPGYDLMMDFIRAEDRNIRCLEECNRVHTSVCQCLPLTSYTDHFSQSVDYLPYIRDICRSERSRQDAKTKRRFLHYLDGIYLALDPGIHKHLCEQLIDVDPAGNSATDKVATN